MKVVRALAVNLEERVDDRCDLRKDGQYVPRLTMHHKYHFKHLNHHYEVTGEYRLLPAHLDGKFLVKIHLPSGAVRQALPAVSGSDADPTEKTFVANNEHHLLQQLGRSYPGLTGFKGV